MRNRILWTTITAALFGSLFGAATASLAAEESAKADGAMPLRLPEQANAEIKSVQDRLYRLAQMQSRYLMSRVHPWEEDPSLKLATQSKSVEHFIRPNAGIISGLAFLYRFGPYDEKIVGVSRAKLRDDYIVPMMRYLTATHRTGSRPTSDGKKWGDHWQSAHWAQTLARSAWWMWDDLPDDLRRSVRLVVAHEAQRFVAQKPPHNLVGDTKAEENAWNSMIFDVAVLLMPSDPRRAVWEKEFQRWAMSSFLRPADEHSRTIVDGRPVSKQFSGANIYDDFTLENHRIVHPNYMGTFSLTLGASADHALSGRKPPEALLHNVREIYANLKWLALPDGGCVFPNGQDWAVFQNPSSLKVHVPMAVYAHDPDAWSAAKVCLEVAEKMQARNPDGAIYVAEETVYRGSQEGALDELGRCWLMLQTAKRIVDRPRPLLGVKRLDAGKIIVHRTPTAVHSVSWGPVVMAQCIPWRLDRVVSPDGRNGVGRIRLAKEKNYLPVRLVSADVKETADGFVADLIVAHGDAVRAELQFRSKADGTLVIREKLTALRDLTTSQIATGSIGILNNPKWVYETHRRKIAFDGRTTDVPSLSGKSMASQGVRRIDVDGALSVASVAPLSTRYVGAKKIERGRATDRLHLNYLGGERSWKSGETISTFEAVVSPRVDSPKKGNE